MCLLDSSSFSRPRAKFSEFMSYLLRLPKLIVLAFVWYTVVMDGIMTRWGGGQKWTRQLLEVQSGA